MDARTADFLAPRGLVTAALAAAAGVLLARAFGLVGAAAVVTAVAILGARRGMGPLLCAVPAALGAFALDAVPAPWPACGPVALDAVAVAGGRFDPANGASTVRVRQRGAELLCVVHGAPTLLPGDRLRGAGRVGPQDARRRAARAPVVETEVGAVSIEPGPMSLARSLARWRDELEQRILARVRGDSGILLCHLVLGRGPPMPDALTAAHRATGLAHLLAVSGAHASMLAWLVGVLFQLCSGRDPWSARRFRWLCGGLLVAYGSVTGWEPPMFRALVAFGVLLAASAAGARATVAAALALPALLTALLLPQDLGSASFCLSYAAVAGLGMSGAFARGARGFSRCTAALRASAWAALATAPLTLVYFGQVAPWTVLATPLLSPLVAVMLGFGLVVAAAGGVAPAVADGAAVVAGATADVYTAAVALVARFPGAPVLASAAPPPAILAAAAAIAAGLVAFDPKRRTVAAGCVLLCLPHFLPLPNTNPPLRLLAVGHGQAAVLRTDAGRTVVVDCGSQRDPVRAARAVEDALGQRRRIDALVVSHGDADHYGGVAELARRVAIDAAFLPKAMRDHPIVAALVRAGAAVHFVADGAEVRVADGVRTRALRVASARDNDRGLWVTAELGGVVCVLPGDAERAALEAWLEAPSPRRADVLVLPHHGRGEIAPVTALLDVLAPRACLVSNRDGELDTPLGRAAAQRGIAVLHTGGRGALTLTLGEAPALAAERPAPIP